jgi:hypothetical protein
MAALVEIESGRDIHRRTAALELIGHRSVPVLGVGRRSAAKSRTWATDLSQTSRCKRWIVA